MELYKTCVLLPLNKPKFTSNLTAMYLLRIENGADVEIFSTLTADGFTVDVKQFQQLRNFNINHN